MLYMHTHIHVHMYIYALHAANTHRLKGSTRSLEVFVQTSLDEIPYKEQFLLKGNR